jgi:hypothetical protein
MQPVLVAEAALGCMQPVLVRARMQLLCGS